MFAVAVNPFDNVNVAVVELNKVLKSRPNAVTAVGRLIVKARSVGPLGGGVYTFTRYAFVRSPGPYHNAELTLTPKPELELNVIPFTVRDGSKF